MAAIGGTPALASFVIDSNDYFTSTNVEDVLAELYAKFGTVTGGLDWQERRNMTEIPHLGT